MNIPNIPNIPTPGLCPTGNYRKDCRSLLKKLIRTKGIDDNSERNFPSSMPADLYSEQKLKLTKCLTTLDLTSLGVGSCVGTGMYLVSGIVARSYAGPAVVFSYMIAAFASILSGACYAEFGVRVPDTTGSAYMYSYVTVGELIAFIIGWNMILEYLIGTSACACALSACFNSLTNESINKAIAGAIGTVFGHTPDLLAFAITILMMIVLTLGVKKSLLFNNILNTLNFATLLFIIGAGLFYINFGNWKDFLPFGWSGVFTGAATCFYAFIGFDIIATTGEEANDPKKSIPIAIIVSLVIILIAYVTSAMMLTLIIPYNEINTGSALVSMFGQVGAIKCQYVVAVGALAGLTVSMFGSMFPMPRIIYAMASDGLIFRSLSEVFPLTGSPAFATITSGIAAACGALLLDLSILVEMMSIGTLLAYTLVSTCVLILRYQPHTSSFLDFLPDTLQTPVAEQNPLSNHQVEKEPPIVKETIYTSDPLPVPPPPTETIPPVPFPFPQEDSDEQSYLHRINIRRITRSSPDSDETYDASESDNSFRDDRYLISNAFDKKYYGTTVHNRSAAPTGIRAKISGYYAHYSRKLTYATYLCPAIFPWMDHGPATDESGKSVMQHVVALFVLIIAFNVTLIFAEKSLDGYLTYVVYVILIAIIGLTASVSRKPQNRDNLMFMTPGVPFLPVMAVLINVYLIFNLSVWTLVRFTVWMTIGFIIYFYYGIKNSTLEKKEEEYDSGLQSPNIPKYHIVKRTQNMTRSPDDPMDTANPSLTRPTTLDPPKTATKNDLFISPSSFPSWDD